MAADATEQTTTAGTVIAGTVYAGTMAAFLYDKQVQVVADGQPDGDKLLSVNIFLPLHPPHQGPQPAPRQTADQQEQHSVS